MNELIACAATLNVAARGELARLAGSGELARMSFAEWRRATTTLGPKSLPGFRERVEQAAAAGFAGIGLNNPAYLAARQSGLSDAEMRTILAEHGVRLVEFEFIDVAAPEGAYSASTEAREQLVAAAGALGARHLLVGTSRRSEESCALDAVAERFATLCNSAAQLGLRVCLEFMPWGVVPDAVSAWNVVRESGRLNGGLMLDSWHYFRGAADPNQLRAIPADRISGIQLDDGGAPTGDPLEDTLRRRLLPGEGSFDLVGLVHLLDELGVTAPYGVEMHADRQRALPLDEAARTAFEATSRVLAEARS